jgi:site-specific DNA-methyltransferase (adenine-specific)
MNGFIPFPIDDERYWERGCFVNQVLAGDCISLMPWMPAESVDLTELSPPYGDMRLYKDAAKAYKFSPIASQLYRVTRDGGIVAWNEADQRENFSLSGTSWKHCLAFMDRGFKLLDVIIVDKNGLYNQYPYTTAQTLEYVFILLKGDRPNFPESNIPRDRKNLHPNTPYHGTRRQQNDQLKERKTQVSGKYSKCTQVWDLADLIQTETPEVVKERMQAHTGQVWNINVAGGLMDTLVPIPNVSGVPKNEHPAPMSDVLAARLVKIYSRPGDLVFDPMNGFGTTTAVAALNNRRWFGIEYIEKWAEVARLRTQCAYITRVKE